MTTKPRPKHLTLRPNEVARFLRPSGLVVMPLKDQPVDIGGGEFQMRVGRNRYTTNRIIERDFKERKKIAEREYLRPLDEWLLPRCPLGGPGDQWVGKESYAFVEGQRDETGKDADCIWYRADGACRFHDGSFWAAGIDEANAQVWQWKSAATMPLDFARIRKTTTRVELRRVRTITEAEAKEVGVEPGCLTCGENCIDRGGCGCCRPDYRDSFIGEFSTRANARYPGAWDRDDYAWFVFYTDTLGKD